MRFKGLGWRSRAWSTSEWGHSANNLLAAVGLAAGVAGAMATSRLVESMLYGLVAGYLPARRASRVDPLVALRAD